MKNTILIIIGLSQLGMMLLGLYIVHPGLAVFGAGLLGFLMTLMLFDGEEIKDES